MPELHEYAFFGRKVLERLGALPYHILGPAEEFGFLHCMFDDDDRITLVGSA